MLKGIQIKFFTVDQNDWKTYLTDSFCLQWSNRFFFIAKCYKNFFLLQKMLAIGKPFLRHSVYAITPSDVIVFFLLFFFSKRVFFFKKNIA